jgi:Mn2+/Fe2+ NRAMP family transporter
MGVSIESGSAGTSPLADSPLDPPDNPIRALRFLGPGFILSAAIVGSGELIATTALGAKAGFVLLWVILLSCLVKVAVQLEYGRQAISSGNSTLQAWSRQTGLRFFGIHWSIYAALVFLISACPGGGGILGGAVQVLAFSFPGTRIVLWIVLVIASLGLLVAHGRYRLIEVLACLFNLVLITTILFCDLAVLSTAYAFTLGDLVSGLSFQLPAEGLMLAFAVFGITGLGSGEIIMYPYWCLEKGYAAWTGPRDGSKEWERRARGWIRVMQLDALLSMAAYTIATCGFYLLGAAVLHRQEGLADGNELIFQLSSIFTTVLGDWSRAVFMLCAFTALYSTLFSNAAGFARLWTDLLENIGVLRTRNKNRRKRILALFSWILPVIWGISYLIVQKPLLLVVVMGLANGGFLLVVAYQALAFRYRYTDPELTPSRIYDCALWLSIITIGLVALRMLM